MEAKEKWNLIVQQYKDNYNQLESKIQKLWEGYCSEFFGYSRVFGEIDTQRIIHIGVGVKTIPDIILRRDNNDILDIELKKYNLRFDGSMEEQLKSYLDLLHISCAMIVCQKIYLYYYDYSKKQRGKYAISFEENNEDGIKLMELLSKGTFDEERIKDYIIDKMTHPPVIVLSEHPKISSNTLKMGTIRKGKSVKKPISEYFVFTNKTTHHKTEVAYEVYNALNQNVGYVFMTDDKRTPAYGNCEIYFYTAYQNKYQKWRRITSYGQRIPWDKFLHKLKCEGQCKYYID